MSAKKTNRKAARKTPAPEARLAALGGGWELERPAITGSEARRSAAATEENDVLPEFLRGSEWVELDRAVARPVAARRGGVDFSAVIPLAVALDSDEPVILVARQQSGALSFHRPDASRRGPEGAALATFQVPVVSGGGGIGRRGIISQTVRVVLVKVAKRLVGEVVEHAAEWAVPRLARELEDRLQKGRPQGWLRVTPETLAGNSLVAAAPAITSGGRGLLFLHGIFSSAHGAFGDLAAGRFFAEARTLYGENIFAFDHPSFSRTPAENVSDLLEALPEGVARFDVVCHSRGGLVLRELLEGPGIGHPKRGRIEIGRVVLVACPCVGSPLTSAEHWDKRLSWLGNLLEMFPENPFTTGAAWLTEALGWFAENIMVHTPGMAAMDPAGDFIRLLQAAPDAPPGAEYHALTANYHPPRGLAARLGDMGIDQFFAGANDLAVWTEGVWKTGGDAAGWVSAARIGCFGPGGNLAPDDPGATNHLNFFKHPRTTDFLLSALKGESLGLPEIDPQVVLDSRNVFGRRGMAAAGFAAARGLPKPEPDRAAERTNPEPNFGTDDWNPESELTLTVISNRRHFTVEGQNKDDDVPLLIARYGSARVVEPFYLRGKEGNAGERWQMIIDGHRLLTDYANGREVDFPHTEDDGAGPSDGFVEKFGEALFKTLFPGEVRTLYNIARFKHKQRRLRISFTSLIPWVADIPWEFAWDPRDESFIACADVRFVRNVGTPTPANRIEQQARPLRILVVSAQPSGLGRLSVEDEEHGIRESFRPLTEAGLVEVEVLPSATPEALHKRLRGLPEAQEFDVLHFIGHGEFDPESGTGRLIFQDEFGRAHEITAATFLKIIRGRNLRIIFLNACETGSGRKADYIRGTAMTLARDGIPAVVANQYSVIDRSASEFSLHFYSCLGRGMNLGDAMREARIALHYCGVERIDWAVPVLFASHPEARLCPPGGPMPGTRDFGPRGLAAITRRGAGEPRTTVGVWDVENSLVYRENLRGTLEELNATQDRFAFHLEHFAAPRYLWAVDEATCDDGVRYLRSSKLMPRLERIRDALRVDYLFCITTLPLRDEDTTAIYLNVHRKTIVFSIWDLHPPLAGISFKQALANQLAITLLAEMSGVHRGLQKKNTAAHPIHTVGYFNDERSVEHIIGGLSLTQKTEADLAAAIKAGKMTKQQFEAITTLLGYFQPTAS